MRYINDRCMSHIDSIRQRFEKEGFAKLPNLFSAEMVRYLKEKIDQTIQAPVDKYQRGFSRISFDLFNDDPVIMGLMKDSAFKQVLRLVTNRQLFYTQGIGLELEKNRSKGVPWHIGTQAFGYQRAEDFGCTVWLPLVPIETNGQGGGLAFVPRDIISGRFLYEFVDPAIPEYVRRQHESNRQPTLQTYLQLRDGILNDDSMKTLLEEFAVQEDFAVGDAVLFDKYVIHRSVPLREGPLAFRTAFTMRFIDSDSTYDSKRAHGLEYPRKLFNFPGATTFHLDVCGTDGEVIANSKYFVQRDSRLI
jgi:hypothetical protein